MDQGIGSRTTAQKRTKQQDGAYIRSQQIATRARSQDPLCCRVHTDDLLRAPPPGTGAINHARYQMRNPASRPGQARERERERERLDALTPVFTTSTARDGRRPLDAIRSRLGFSKQSDQGYVARTLRGRLTEGGRTPTQRVIRKREMGRERESPTAHRTSIETSLYLSLIPTHHSVSHPSKCIDTLSQSHSQRDQVPLDAPERRVSQQENND